MSKDLNAMHEELSELHAEKVMWDSLLEHAGWKKYDEDMGAQRTLLLITVGATPLSSLSAVPAQEFMKGEGNGIHKALTYVRNRVETVSMEIERLRTAIELETNDDATAQTDESGNASRSGSGSIDNPDAFGGG